MRPRGIIKNNVMLMCQLNKGRNVVKFSWKNDSFDSLLFQQLGLTFLSNNCCDG